MKPSCYNTQVKGCNLQLGSFKMRAYLAARTEKCAVQVDCVHVHRDVQASVTLQSCWNRTAIYKAPNDVKYPVQKM